MMMKRTKLRRVLACVGAIILLLSAGIFSLADEGSLSGNSLSGNALPTDTEAEAAPAANSLSGNAVGAKAGDLVAGEITHLTEGAEGVTYDIGEDITVMIHSTGDEPIVFKNCTFNLSGKTTKISGNQQGVSYNNGEVVTKLWIGENVRFEQCTFTAANGGKSSSAGFDACIYFFSGDIRLKDCTLTGNGWDGQFLGLYGKSGSVTFDNCDISTVNHKNGWSYAMYGGSVLKLINGSTMTATGMTTTGGNINAFYSGDNKTGYDAIFIEDSVVDFSDNRAGGFAINNVNIYVKNSEIHVNNNLGNACNSGYWFVDNSTIHMNGNRGGHALSCIGFEMTNSELEILHNGYAGIYIQRKNSSLTNCTVDLRCNGEKLLSYSAGDLWLNGHTLTVDNCTSKASAGSAWLGGVGRKGAVVTGQGSVVAYDLSDNAVDNLKSNTTPVLTNAALSKGNKHVLFLNPFMDSPYARGNAETAASNNDADLFKDDRVTARTDIIGKDNAKIDELTDAQLSHHKYNWAGGEVTDQATETTFGVMRYSCSDVCAAYLNHSSEHANSFDCQVTFVYAPLVGLAFEANAGTGKVDNMPDNMTAIEYNTAPGEPEKTPVREGYQFTGWYTTPECEKGTKYNFTTELTANWTVVYAGWKAITPKVIYHWVGDVQPTDVKCPEEEGCAYGAEYTAKTQTPSEGYTFHGWYQDKECTKLYVNGTKINEEVLNENFELHLYGKWTVNAPEPTEPETTEPETTEPETTAPETTEPEHSSGNDNSDSHENWIIARKVWSDETAEHPTIWFKLYRQTPDGKPEAVPGAELKKLENGRIEVAWDGLDLASPEGKPYTFFVKEVDENGNDYTPEYYVKQESGLTVINTYVGAGASTAASGQSPKTGDTAPVLLYGLLLCAAAGTAAAVIIKKRRNKIG